MLRLGFVRLLLSVVNLIAPLPISNTKPIVNIIKKITNIENPKLPISYKVTPTGIIKIISRSKTRNNKATKKKWIWKFDLVWPKILINPHS